MISKEYMTAIVKVNPKDYYIRDYLGSVRGVVDGNGTLEQATDYHSGGIPSSDYGNFTADDRLHTGKEFNNFAGLAWYDNSARMYDPITTRFTTPDPLAEKYPDQSPYAHCANNPLKYIDPTGLEWMYDPTMGQSERQQIEEMKKNSKMFSQIYNDLEASKAVYTMKIGKTTDPNSYGEFNSKTNTITFNKDYSNIMAYTLFEEVYHAYQKENGTLNDDNNPEYEAKVATLLMLSENGLSSGEYNGMEQIALNINTGAYSNLTSNTGFFNTSFDKQYLKNGIEFQTYNQLNNIGNPSYKKAITKVPSLLLNLIYKSTK